MVKNGEAEKLCWEEAVEEKEEYLSLPKTVAMTNTHVFKNQANIQFRFHYQE